MPVARDARRPAPEARAPLALLSASHRGIDAPPDRLVDVERFVRRTVVAPRATIARRPMRSPWWLAAFVLCLTAEWYHRRRRGAR